MRETEEPVARGEERSSVHCRRTWIPCPSDRPCRSVRVGNDAIVFQHLRVLTGISPSTKGTTGPEAKATDSSIRRERSDHMGDDLQCNRTAYSRSFPLLDITGVSSL